MHTSLLIAAIMMTGLSACHQEGPAEKAGKSLDNAGQSLSDALNPPQGPAQSAGRKVDRALGNGAFATRPRGRNAADPPCTSSKGIHAMAHVTYTDLRQNLSRYMDQAIDDRDPILVTRQGGKGNVVILSEAEFEGWQETLHLLGNPANAKRLLESVREADAGMTRERELVDASAPTNA